MQLLQFVCESNSRRGANGDSHDFGDLFRSGDINRAAVVAPPPFDPQSPMRMAFAGILGLTLLGLGRKRRFFPSRWMAMLLLVGGLMAATALTACGGGSNSGGGGGGSTPVMQTVTVTGTSGTNVASTSIQLTVT